MSYIEENTAIVNPYYETNTLNAAERPSTPTITERVQENRKKHKIRLFPTRSDHLPEISGISSDYKKIDLPLPSDLKTQSSSASILADIITKLERIESEMVDHAYERNNLSSNLVQKDISSLKRKIKDQESVDGSIYYLRKIQSLISGILGGALLAVDNPIAKIAGGLLVGSALLFGGAQDLKESGSNIIDPQKMEMAASSLAFIGNGISAVSGQSAFRGSYLGMLLKITGASTAFMSQSYAQKSAQNKVDSTKLTANLESHQNLQKDAEVLCDYLHQDKMHILKAIIMVLDCEIDSIKHANKKHIQG